MIKLCAFSDEASASLDGQIKALKRNGINYTELRSVDGVNVASITEENAKKIKEELDKNGISVWSLGSPYGKVSLSDGFSEEKLFIQLNHLCLLCKIFDCDKIRVFSFYNAYDKKEQVFSLLNKSVKIASEYGVNLYHENEKDIYGDTAERVKELYDNVKGLQFVYDPANYIQSGQSADTTLPLAKFASYYHIKDVVTDTGELVPAGYGDGKISELLGGIDRDTTLTVEPHLAVFAGYAEIDGRELKNRFHFKNNDEAFDCAVNSLKDTLTKSGYYYSDGGYIKR